MIHAWSGNRGLYDLIKKLKKTIIEILIKIGIRKKRCHRLQGRVLTEDQALEFRKLYSKIPDNMLEFLGDYV